MAELRLPSDLYDVPAVRALDAAAIASEGIPALTLMMRAGAAALRVLQQQWSGIKEITILCGGGNNAGDGYALAGLAHRAGYVVTVVQVGSTDGLSDAARMCLESMLVAGLRAESEFDAIDDAGLIVDALFGIGLGRVVEGQFAAAIARVNQTRVPVLSIDIPSGINASTGQCMGVAVRAAVTITFIGLKQGLFTADGPQYTGDVVFDTLDVPLDTYAAVQPSAKLFEMHDVRSKLQPRARTAHKGDHGHVLIVGGAPGYSGAIRLAGEAAARAGAGLVSVATHPDVANSVNGTRPELMVHPVARPVDLAPLLARADVVAIGPGLSQSDWATALFAAVLDCALPLVVDADALNLLAIQPSRREAWVLTPHPGEAARLLAQTTADIHADRFASAMALQKTYGGSIVLKGAGSIVADGKLFAVLRAGNPGMGSGGMGDALTGIIAGLMAQGYAIGDAARMGACVHASAADRAATDGERGLLASDLMPHIRALVN
jgi:hydroxyethylthiazole kinase-like uncharacterized protein yjeF